MSDVEKVINWLGKTVIESTLVIGAACISQLVGLTLMKGLTSMIAKK